MSKIMSKILALVLFMAVFAQASFARAGETPWAGADQVRARLLSGGNGKAAVEVEIAKGWHSYWKVPGDSGLAPVFQWDASQNVKSASVQWPFPKRFDEMGLVTFGYEGTQIFPVTIEKVNSDEKTRLDLALDIMVCADICIPQKLKMFMDLEDEPQPQAMIIDAAYKKIPKIDAPEKLATIETIVTGPDALVITATSTRGFDKADVFAVVGDIALTAKPEITPDAADNRKAIIRIAKGTAVTGFEGKDVTVVLTYGNEAVEKSVKF